MPVAGIWPLHSSLSAGHGQFHIVHNGFLCEQRLRTSFAVALLDSLPFHVCAYKKEVVWSQVLLASYATLQGNSLRCDKQRNSGRGALQERHDIIVVSQSQDLLWYALLDNSLLPLFIFRLCRLVLRPSVIRHADIRRITLGLCETDCSAAFFARVKQPLEYVSPSL